MSDRPRIELSTVQIVSSMGAAVTGAVLTSYLGDGGTILGTAVGAGVSTTGFAVYKHYLVRTKDKVAPVIVEHARQWSPTTQSSGHAAPAGTQQAPRDNGQTWPGASPSRADIGQTRADFGQTPDDLGQAGADIGQTRRDLGQTGARFTPTRNDLGQAGADAGQTRRDLGQTGSYGQARSSNGQTWGPGASRTRADVGLADAETARFGTVRMGSDGRNGSDGSGRNNGTNGTNGGGKHSGGLGGAVRGLRGHPRWVITAVTSVAVFLVAMLVITLIEFGTGKPIDASVWGHTSGGTTLGNVTGGTSNKGTVQPTTTGHAGYVGHAQPERQPRCEQLRAAHLGRDQPGPESQCGAVGRPDQPGPDHPGHHGSHTSRQGRSVAEGRSAPAPCAPGPARPGAFPSSGTNRTRAVTNGFPRRLPTRKLPVEARTGGLSTVGAEVSAAPPGRPVAWRIV